MGALVYRTTQQVSCRGRQTDIVLYGIECSTHQEIASAPSAARLNNNAEAVAIINHIITGTYKPMVRFPHTAASRRLNALTVTGSLILTMPPEKWRNGINSTTRSDLTASLAKNTNIDNEYL
jgi:hypothetical protein